MPVGDCPLGFACREAKRQFGDTKVKHRGLAKSTASLLTPFALSSLSMVRRGLLLGCRVSASSTGPRASNKDEMPLLTASKTPNSSSCAIVRPSGHRQAVLNTIPKQYAFRGQAHPSQVTTTGGLGAAKPWLGISLAHPNSGWSFRLHFHCHEFRLKDQRLAHERPCC